MWWSSRSVCPSLCPSVRWSCSRLSARSYGVHSCQTLPFYQLPVLIYNTDLPYCVCDEILFNLNSCPSMRESSQSGLKTIQEMRSFFLQVERPLCLALLLFMTFNDTQICEGGYPLSHLEKGATGVHVLYKQKSSPSKMEVIYRFIR